MYAFVERRTEEGSGAAIEVALDPDAPVDRDTGRHRMARLQPPMPHRALRVPVGGGELAALWIGTPEARYTLLFSHGNASDLGMMAPFLVELSRVLGVGVFAYDYSGYGLSSGRAREAQQYRDVRAAWRHLTATLGVPPSRVVLYGQSIGSSPSIDLAAALCDGRGRGPAGLIVHSGLLSGIRLLRPQCTTSVCFDPFRNVDKIGRVQVRTLVIHGRRDEVVPFHHGERLHAGAPRAVAPLWVDQAGHDDIEFSPAFFPRLLVFLEELAA